MKIAHAFKIGACLLVLSTACLVFAQTKNASKNSLSGTWDCIAHLSGEDDIPFTMALEQKEDVVTGSITTHDGMLEIKAGTFKGGALELHLESPDGKYAVTGKLDGDQFKGQWSKDPDGISGDWEGKRSTQSAESK